MSFQKKSSTAEPVELYTIFQNVGPNGQIIISKGSVAIYKINDYMVYKSPYNYILKRAKQGKDGNYVDDKTLINTVKYEYYIYNQNKQIGYKFDSVDVLHPTKISIDSFQRVRMLKGTPFYSADDSLASSAKNVGQALLIQKRVQKQWDEAYADSSYFYFSNRYKTAPYVFSKTLDSITHLKLYKISYIFNKRPKGKYPFDIPRREYTFELRKAKEALEIPGLLERFKAMEVNLK